MFKNGTCSTQHYCVMDSSLCLICRDGNESSGCNFITRCNHKYHQECLRLWFMTSGEEQRCPLCRSKISTNQLLEYFHNKQESKEDFLKKHRNHVIYDPDVIECALKEKDTIFLKILHQNGARLIDSAAKLGVGSLKLIECLLIEDQQNSGEEEAEIVSELDGNFTKEAKMIQLKIVRYMIKNNLQSMTQAVDLLITGQDMTIIKYFLNYKIVPEQKVMNMAIKYGNLQVIRYLLENGASFHMFNTNCSNGHGCKNNIKSRTGIQVHHLNKNNVLKTLLDPHSPSFNAGSSSNLFRLAVFFGNLDLVKELLEQGTAFTEDTIYFASKYGHLDIVKYLTRHYNQNMSNTFWTET